MTARTKRIASKGAGKSRKTASPLDRWEPQIAAARERLKAAWTESEHKAEEAWHQAAQAALHWVTTHRGRVEQFRRALKGTPLYGTVDTMIDAVRTEARAPRKTAAKRGTTRRRAAKKTPAARRRTR